MQLQSEFLHNQCGAATEQFRHMTTAATSPNQSCEQVVYPTPDFGLSRQVRSHYKR